MGSRPSRVCGNGQEKQTTRGKQKKHVGFDVVCFPDDENSSDDVFQLKLSDYWAKSSLLHDFFAAYV